MREYAIEIENLKKSFKQLAVLKGVNLTVKPGEVLTMLGPNGAGKTTIIRILSTLLKPDSGKVIVNGYNLKTQPQEIRQSIGLTGQYTALDEFHSGLDYMEMMGILYH